VSILRGLYVGDAMRVPLADGSVQCAVTSPPYWNLRDYGVDGQLGNEPRPDCLGWATGDPCGECYICHLVGVFRDVWRVLRHDGTLWLVLGDSYSSTRKWGGHSGGKNTTSLAGGYRRARREGSGIPAKNLIGIPWRVALALQKDGWILRRDIIWNKPNGLVGSQQDRPTGTHEYVFLLSKSPRYFYDAEAVKEPAAACSIARQRRGTSGSNKNAAGAPGQPPQSLSTGRENDPGREVSETRTLRAVWNIPTAGYSGAHFATFPPALVEICVRAGTSERGACAQCGAPIRRIVVKEFTAHSGNTRSAYSGDKTAGRLASLRQAAREQGEEYANRTMTVGWKHTCKCGCPDTRPCLVLDPFSGAGTTGLVCWQLGRSFVEGDLNSRYTLQAQKRVAGAQMVMAGVGV